jgi:hypothetical protein
MTTKTTAHRRERRTMLIAIDDRTLLPLGLKDLPKPIEDANNAAHEAIAQLREAERLKAEADQQADAAANFDRHAATAAAEAGEEQPPATEPRKRAAAKDAALAADAALEVARRRVRALYDAIEDHYDDYLSGRQSLAEEAAEPMASAVGDLMDRIIAFRIQNETYQLARSFHNNPNSAALSASNDPATTLRKQYEKALARLRGLHPNRRDGAITNDLPVLLAAITLNNEDELAGRDDAG